MSNLLKAVGFWMWGLIAIGLSVSLVSVSYRMLSVYRSHDLSAGSPPSVASPNAEVAVPPPLFSDNNEKARTEPKATNDGASREPVISRAIAKEMSAAQTAMRAGQWPEALKNLEAAELNAPLSAYDTKTIEDNRGFSYVRLNNLKAAQKAYEAALSTGAYREEELAKIFRLLFQLAASNQQPAKAIEYGEKAHDVGALKSNDFLIMSQLYYQRRDCKTSAVWGDNAITSFREEGVAPKEVLYQIKLQCASDANDTAAMIAALSDLVRLTNKTSYWNNLIRLERQDERDDRNLLMIYRVMYDTNSMQADTDYIEMAQLLGDAGLPGEAQMVLERAMSSGIIKDDHKERTNRLLNAMKTRADADKKGVPALDAEASRNPAGQLDVKLGEVYFGAGDYQGASTAITRGLAKGQITQLDEAYVYLARDWMAQRNPADAKKMLAQLRTLPNISPRVLRLWSLYADTIPEARSASL
jgi:tetratricopeptide (TPR) repeat protein